MGFDNECIVNIQSLAGEYFCPVCRLLVYPNEALQSQCTHLYCKPCLTYIVSTTRACPYDGYLVTEADSKPLLESNKTLAETIGKIPVHCLYHRSGCTWQGSLSDCTSHCSGCAFGNSPVVCNRCGIQIVHHQVQEHAQNCPGVQGQVQQTEVAQNASVSSAAASTDPNQTVTQVGATVSQAPISQTVVATITPGQDSSQLNNPTSQTQPLGQTVAQPTAEQLYQQQQYQQYYQQYAGYDPYQQQYQQYYPYQQPVAPQYQQHVQAYVQPQPQPQPQSQSQPQPQAQPQSQPQPQSQQLPQAFGQSQPISQVQAPAAPQSQNQTQVSQQQPLQPAVQPHSQIQSLSHPAAHGQPLSQLQPYSYPYPQMQPHPVQTQPQQHMQIPQYQQPHPQMQHSQPQVPQPVQSYLVSQPQVRPQLQPHAPVQHLSQPQMHPQQLNQPLTPNIQPQLHHTSAHAVTGHQSYSQPPPQQNMHLGAAQLPMQMPPQGGSQAQSQHPIQVKNQLPQQPPMTRPLHSHAMFPNQQQPGLLPSPVQGHHFLPSQQQAVYAPAQHPGQTNQRPVMQPGQQPYIQQHMPMSSHLGPQGQAQHSQTCPPPLVNVTSTHNTQHNQSQSAIGRPSMHNQAVKSQPFAQSASAITARPVHAGSSNLLENQNVMVGANNQVQGSAGIQSMSSELTQRQMNVCEQQNDSSSWQLGKNVKDLDTMSRSATEMKPVKSETDMKQIEIKKQNGEDPQSVWTSVAGVNVVENSELVKKNLVKEEAIESKWQPSGVNKPSGDNCNEHAAAKGKEIQDGPLLKNSSLETEVGSQSGNGPPSSGENAPPAISQSVATPQGTATVRQRPNGISPSQLPYPGLPNQPLSSGNASSQLGNHGPVNAPHPGQPLIPAENYQQTVFKHPQGSDIQHSGLPGPGYPGEPTHRSTPGLGFQSPAPTLHAGASNLSRVESVGGPQYASLPPGDMHVGMRPTVPEGLRGPKNMIPAETVPHQRPRYLNGPQSLNLQEERLKSFPVPGQSNIDRRDLEDDLKKFPRSSLDAELASKFGNYTLGPHESGFHGFNYDSHSKYNSGEGVAASGFIPHPHLPNEAGERPLGFHDDTMGKSDSARHPDFFGFGPGYGRHMNNFTPRSPVMEYAEISSRRFGPLSGSLHGKAGIDDFDSRDPRRFGDSVGTAFLDGRYPHLPSHMQRGEFEGPGNLRMGEHPMSDDFLGHDGFTGQFRGEYLGPHSLPRHMQLGEPISFGPHIGHFRDTELGVPQSFESFSRGNRQRHPQLGEPGFRSSFSLPGFPNDGGFLTGDIGSFNNLRKRKVASMGWCRICKVDCESVEGLDLHAQTREHQKMAMDMVKGIKQNAKKQKSAHSEQSYVEDRSKSKNAGSEAQGNKH